MDKAKQRKMFYNYTKLTLPLKITVSQSNVYSTEIHLCSHVSASWYV